MKKSNIFLISAFSLAFCWTLLIGWFAASAINNYVHGKDPYFARTHRQYLESRKKIFPLPASELVISGEGTMILTILPGKKLTVLSAHRIWNCVYTDLKNGKSMISFKKLKEYCDPVIITLPGVPSLSLDNFSDVTLKGLNQKEIHLQGRHVQSFHADSCKIGTLNLDFPGEKDHQDIDINKSNQINTFIVSVKGFGKIRLETAGQIKNQISLSDLIHVDATYYVMKKLSIGPESRKSK
jgi:hypothetical protein